MDYDLVIRNGLIVDGTGMPAYFSDVGIVRGRIATIGRIEASASEVIDARGLVVAPGFIDPHTHYDAQLFWDPLATPTAWHGFTSVLITNCGFGIAPLKPEHRDYIMRMLAEVEAIPLGPLAHHVPWSWRSYADYLDTLDHGLGVNVMSLAPHSTIRYHVMGDDARKRPATADEIRAMEAVVVECLEAGAFGFSSSHGPVHFDSDGVPVPSRWADREEVVALARALKAVGRGVVCLVPQSVPTISRDDLDYIARLSRESGRPVIWNVLFHTWNAPDNWRAVLDWTRECFRRGGRAHPLGLPERFDLNFSFRSGLFGDMPAWKRLFDASREDKLRALRQPEVRAALQADLDDPTPRVFSKRMQDVLVLEAKLERNRPWVGKSATDMGLALGKSPLDAMIDLALDEDLETDFVIVGFLNGDEQALRSMIEDPYLLIGGSDGGAHMAFVCQVSYSSHLLAYWVRDRRALTLETAVRRLTFEPALLLGLPDRGLVRPGYAADLVVFDPDRVAPGPREEVRDLPGGGVRIIRRAQGYRATVVNGEFVWREGEFTGHLPGHVLRSGR